MSDTRTALRRDLDRVAARLGRDELRALVILATRVWVGQSRYGCLDVRRDPRDFRREALEELCDAVFYLAAALLRRQKASRPARRRGSHRA